MNRFGDDGTETVKVSMADLVASLKDLNPAYGVASEALRDQYLPYGVLSCGRGHAEVADALTDILRQVLSGKSTGPVSALLVGASGLKYDDIGARV